VFMREYIIFITSINLGIFSPQDNNFIARPFMPAKKFKNVLSRGL